jgi:maltooligosyltrehalose trehalohydrolase
VLAQQVAKGRRAEFGQFAAFASEAARAAIPDPNAPGSFDASHLRWDELEREPHRQWHSDVRTMLRLRQEKLLALLRHGCQGGEATVDGDTLRLCWPLGPDGAAGRLHLLAHFGADGAHDVAPSPGHVLYTLGAPMPRSGAWALARGAVVLTFDGPDHG